jgi:hypothetical protein
MSKPTSILTLDNKVIEPIEIGVSAAVPGNKEPAEILIYNVYRVAIGNRELTIRMDDHSVVELSSDVFGLYDQTDEDNHEFADVYCLNARVHGCFFRGTVCIENAVVHDSQLINSNILFEDALMPEKDRTFGGARLEDSCTNNSLIQGNEIVLRGSNLHDSNVETGEDGSVFMDNTLLTMVHMRSDNGVIDLESCRLTGCMVTAEGAMKLTNQWWDNVILSAKSIHLPGKFYFFTLELPKATLHFYADAEGNYHLKEDNLNFEVAINDPEFSFKLASFLADTGHLVPGDITDYVEDCVSSRLRILQVLETAEAEQLTEEPSNE